jgi:hypothetical protein
MFYFNDDFFSSGYYRATFTPRALALHNEHLLLGGMFGGILKINLINGNYTWLDEYESGLSNYSPK